MGVERTPASASLIDVLDRVLDRGVVLDPWLRGVGRGVSLAGRQVKATSDVLRHPPRRPRPAREG